MRDTTVTLPQGMQLNPSAANGLEACSEAQIGFEGFNDQALTDRRNSPTQAAAPARTRRRSGSVHIKTPLLGHELEGAVYLASPAPNGQNRAESVQLADRAVFGRRRPGLGVLVKLAGEGSSTTTRSGHHDFQEHPAAALRRTEDRTVRWGTCVTEYSGAVWELSGGERVRCRGRALWQNHPRAFEVISGAGGGPCPVRRACVLARVPGAERELAGGCVLAVRSWKSPVRTVTRRSRA